jgi:hypothetical protein
MHARLEIALFENRWSGFSKNTFEVRAVNVVTFGALRPLNELQRVDRMQNVILLILCLAIGIALRRFGRVPANAHMTLNTFVIYVAFPALILSQVHGLHLRPNLLLPVMMPWLMFLMGAALFWTIARYLDLPPATTGALMLTEALGNTSFPGLPAIEVHYGKSGIATGILIDTLGTYLVLSTLGVTIACIYSRGLASSWNVHPGRYFPAPDRRHPGHGPFGRRISSVA